MVVLGVWALATPVLRVKGEGARVEVRENDGEVKAESRERLNSGSRKKVTRRQKRRAKECLGRGVSIECERGNILFLFLTFTEIYQCWCV